VIAELKPYPAMKDSGVPWLGEVPEHWEVEPNRALFEEVKERNCPDEQMLSVTITKGVIPQHDLLSDSSKKDSSNQDKTAYKLVQPGDIAYDKMRAWQGAIGVSEYRGIISPAYVVQRLRGDAEPRYYHYLLRIPAFATEAERWSYGITSDMWSLRPEHFKLIYACRPPRAEQSTIVRFLDYADRRIRRYIRAKQKLIELLEEQKQAIIHRAVTRGLDPNVRLKPSGVEWLGDVPEHWEVKKIRFFARVGNGSTPSRGRSDYWAVDGFPWLNSGSVNRSRIDSADQFVTDRALQECHLPTLRPGVVLVAITGQGKTRGRAAVSNIAATINQHLAYIDVVGATVTSEFLQTVLTAGYSYLRSISDDSGSTKGALTCADVRHLKVPLPPEAEQRQILEALQQELAGLEHLVGRARSEIDLLGEFRTRLVADVVTGELDVRRAAQRVQDDEDETEIDFGMDEGSGELDQEILDDELEAV